MKRVNLIPDREQASRAMRRRAGGWCVAICCVVPLVVVAFSLKYYQEGLAEDARIETDKLTVEIASSRAALGDLRIAVGRADGRRARAVQMQDKRRWSTLISEVVDAMPEGVWLTSLSSDPPVAAVSPGATKERETTETESGYARFDVDAARGLVVQGICTDSASPLRFVTALKATGMFGAISHEHIRRASGTVGGTFQFEIRCGW